MRRLSAVVLIAVALALVVSACAQPTPVPAPEPTKAPAAAEPTTAPAEPTVAPTEPPAPELAGTISIAGSTSVQPLAEKLANKFTEANPKVQIDVQGGGSSVGLGRRARARWTSATPRATSNLGEGAVPKPAGFQDMLRRRRRYRASQQPGDRPHQGAGGRHPYS
mgnify:FL=1